MLYYFFEYLYKVVDVPGAGVFQYITFRSALAVILSMLISTIYGKRIITFLRNQQVGETVRELGLAGQNEKAGTPTMGGLIIIIATLIPVLLLTKLNNIYIILLIVTTLWMGTIGFIDDYIKIFKKDKQGLKGIFKVIGQVGLGVIVGTVLYTHPGVTIRTDKVNSVVVNQSQSVISALPNEEKSTATTIPFFKNNEFDYAELLAWTGEGYEKWAWLVFIPIVIFIITAVSNGANLTDGIDGLAAGTSAISVLALGIFTFVSGNIIFSNYLNIMYIPNSGEMTVFIAAFVGALVFGYAQDKIGHKLALSLTLVGWSITCVMAALTSSKEVFWWAAALAGVCMGSSQSTGRAMAGMLIPANRLAEFFGLWTFAIRLASIVGPLGYGLITWLTDGNQRLAIASTTLLFVVGWLLLLPVNVQRGQLKASGQS